MKKLILFFVIFLNFNSLSAKSGFEIYGDIFQMLPIATLAYSVAHKDYQGAKEQVYGSAATMALTLGVKYSFVAISKKDEQAAKISQRPNKGSFDGFPSGHTAFAFSAVGWAQKRHGYKASVPLGVLATAVGVSRVYAERHTTTQVIFGAITGFGFSYFLASQKNQNLSINFIPIEKGAFASVQYRF